MIHIHGSLSQPNKCSLDYAIRVLKIATDRDLLHNISIVFTEYSGLYNDLYCLQQYTLQSTVHSWTTIRLECKHIITVTHTKFTQAILAMALARTK